MALRFLRLQEIGSIFFHSVKSFVLAWVCRLNSDAVFYHISMIYTHFGPVTWSIFHIVTQNKAFLVIFRHSESFLTNVELKHPNKTYMNLKAGLISELMTASTLTRSERHGRENFFRKCRRSVTRCSERVLSISLNITYTHEV